MNSYTYSISLRIFHPIVDLSYLGCLLCIEPSRIWKAGEPRSTPKGTSLDGKNKESYWCGRLTADNVDSEKYSLEAKLAEWTSKLDAHRSVLSELLAEGGRIEYFVWINCKQNLGFELGHLLLADMASLGITLGIVCDP